MTEFSERYRKVAGTFTQRAHEVPDGAWDNPAPCEGWVARDVVRHMVEWMPGFFPEAAGVEFPKGPSADVDPAGAWDVHSAALQAALDDPEMAGREFDSPTGRVTVEQAIDQFMTSDVLVHTWDLARAAGLDETIDAEESERLYEGMVPYDELLRNSGHYGPRVEVPDDADAQTKLVAFTGRQP